MGNTESLGFGILNSTPYPMTIALSMAATHYYENNVKSGEIFYRWPGAVHYTVYAYPYNKDSKMTNIKACSEIALASILGISTVALSLATLGSASLLIGGVEATAIVLGTETVIIEGMAIGTLIGVFNGLVGLGITSIAMKKLTEGIIGKDKSKILNGIKNVVIDITKKELSKHNIKYNENIEIKDDEYKIMTGMIDKCFDKKNEFNQVKLHKMVNIIINEMINIIKYKIEFEGDIYKNIFININNKSIKSVYKLTGNVILNIELRKAYLKPVKKMGCYGGGNGSWIELSGGPIMNKHTYIVTKKPFELIKRTREYIMGNGQFTSKSFDKYYTEIEGDNVKSHLKELLLTNNDNNTNDNDINSDDDIMNSIMMVNPQTKGNIINNNNNNDINTDDDIKIDE